MSVNDVKELADRGNVASTNAANSKMHGEDWLLFNLSKLTFRFK